MPAKSETNRKVYRLLLCQNAKKTLLSFFLSIPLLSFLSLHSNDSVTSRQFIWKCTPKSPVMIRLIIGDLSQVRKPIRGHGQVVVPLAVETQFSSPLELHIGATSSSDPGICSHITQQVPEHSASFSVIAKHSQKKQSPWANM